MINFRRLFLLICLFIPLIVFGQFDNYKDGYVITNNQDTLWGKILYPLNTNTPQQCRFKSNDNAITVDYKPSDILGFRYIGSKYFIAKDINLRGLNKICFIELLVSGLVDMYYYEDFVESIYYIEDNNGSLIPLTNDEIEKQINGTTFIGNSKSYIGVLKYRFNNSTSTLKNIEKLKFSQKDFINIASKYHNEMCTNNEQCVVYEKDYIASNKEYFNFFKNLTANTIALGFVSEINHSMFNLEDNSNFYYLDYFKNNNFANPTFLTYGVYLEVKTDKISAFKFDLMLGKWDINSIHTYTDTEYWKRIYTNDISLNRYLLTSDLSYKNRVFYSKYGDIFIGYGFYYKRFIEDKYFKKSTYYTRFGLLRSEPDTEQSVFSKNEGGLTFSLNYKSNQWLGINFGAFIKYRLGYSWIRKYYTPYSTIAEFNINDDGSYTHYLCNNVSVGLSVGIDNLYEFFKKE